jgi:hypothetical protein
MGGKGGGRQRCREEKLNGGGGAGGDKDVGKKSYIFYTVLSTEMDLWYCTASREMENISRGPYLLRFVTILTEGSM